MLDKRLVALYESGNTSYIDLLLSSADLTDFISKYYLISELATIDTELINSIRVAKQAVEDSKVGLENNKTSLESAKAEQVQKQNELAAAKKEKEKKVANLSAEEKELEKELAAFEADKKKIQDELIAIAKREEEERKRREEEAKKNGSTSSNNTYTAPSSHGYIFPVKGLTRASINNPSYPSYRGHTGIDINRNVVRKTSNSSKIWYCRNFSSKKNFKWSVF